MMYRFRFKIWTVDQDFGRKGQWEAVIVSVYCLLKA